MKPYQHIVLLIAPCVLHMASVYNAAHCMYSIQILLCKSELGSARVRCHSIDCIDYVTGIGNAHAHNGVHSVLRLG